MRVGADSVATAIGDLPAGALAATTAAGVHRAFIACPLLDVAIRRRPHKPLTSTNAPPASAGDRDQIMKEIIGRSMGF